MSLIVYFIEFQLKEIQKNAELLGETELSKYLRELKKSVVHTAYSNIGCLEFLNTQGFKTEISRTGIKNLFQKSLKSNISVFFEYNGHGGIVIDDNTFSFLRTWKSRLLEK